MRLNAEGKNRDTAVSSPPLVPARQGGRGVLQVVHHGPEEGGLRGRRRQVLHLVVELVELHDVHQPLGAHPSVRVHLRGRRRRSGPPGPYRQQLVMRHGVQTSGRLWRTSVIFTRKKGRCGRRTPDGQSSSA